MTTERTFAVLYSYAHADEDLRQQLEKHLALLRRQGIVDQWHDRKIGAGSESAGQISDHLERADVILLLISSDFLASDYCFEIEMKRAMERHDAGSSSGQRDPSRWIVALTRPLRASSCPSGPGHGGSFLLRIGSRS